MLNFCTLFNTNYLARGLALYESLEKNCTAFHLYVYAFDDASYDCLKKLNYPHLTPVAMKEWEDEAILAVKPTRSMAEYCWTSTATILRYSITHYKLESCTYLDADLYFYSNPQVLFDEIAGNSVAISSHRYTPIYDQSVTSGIYCVQFMFFRNDERGMRVLNWWRDRCIEWCFARYEDGKFGDQKYLDNWPSQFEGVHVFKHRGEGLAPWNIQQSRPGLENGKLTITEISSGKKWNAVYFHFHGVKFFTDQQVALCGSLYEFSKEQVALFYFPYLNRLLEIEADLKAKGFTLNSNGATQPAPGKMAILVQFLKERLLNIKMGKASPFHFKMYNFSRHNHYYSLNQIR